jgi:CHAD domain-containing protein
VSVERETKLDVGPGFRLPGFDDVRDGIQAVRAEPQRTRTTYWDTEDLRLARWGLSLRHRDGQGWTLKLPADEEEGALNREEIEAEGPPTHPPASLADLVVAYTRGEPLRRAVTLHTVRTRVAFTGADRAELGEVVDDEVSVLTGRRIAARFREVEVETHDEALAGAAIARLRAAGAGETVLTPKYLRALGPRASAPPELVVRLTLPQDAPVRDLVSTAMTSSTIRLIRADAGVRLGEQPEAVHSARVAVRRLRSDLRTFRSVLDPAWSGPLRDELGWLGSSLGEVRDLDVLGDRLAGRLEDLGLTDPQPDGAEERPQDRSEDRGASTRLIGGVRAARSDARERLLAELRSDRYVALLERLVAASAEPGVLPEAADRRAASTLVPLMAGPWKHVERACRAIADDSPDEVVHAARIRAKRARYAAEALAPLVGAPARRFGRAAARLQDVLGEHQDAVVAEAWLRDAARSSPSTAFVAGLLVARERQARADARASWRPAWKALRRKKLRFWT